MLGTLSLDDKFHVLGRSQSSTKRHKAPSYRADRLELYRPARLHRLQPPQDRENLQQHVIHLSTTYRSRILFSFFVSFPFPPSSVGTIVFLHRLSETSVLNMSQYYYLSHTSRGKILQEGEINDLYSHKISTHFSSTHPDTKLISQFVPLFLHLFFFISYPPLNPQRPILSSYTKLLNPIFSHSTVFTEAKSPQFPRSY